MSSRLPSSLSQLEEAIGHWRGRRGGDGQSLVDCFEDEAAVEAPGEGAKVAWEMFGRDGAVRGQEAVLTLASTVFAQRKAGCRAAVRSEPVTWRSWMRPGCHAMHRNHCPPSLTMVVPALTRAHSRLVSAVWNPRTTCRRAYKGRLSAVVSTAMIRGCGRADHARSPLRCAHRRYRRRRSRSAARWRQACSGGPARSSPASVCAEPARRHWSRSQGAGPARCWTALSCPGRADAWRGTTPASAAWCPAGRCRRSATSDGGTVGIVEVDVLGSHNTLTPHTADT